VSRGLSACSFAAGWLLPGMAALAPVGAPLPRERANVPFSPAEIAGFLALADAQPTAGRRMRAAGWSAWARGPGWPARTSARSAAPTSSAASGGVIVEVGGRRPRAVVRVSRRGHGVGGRGERTRSMPLPVSPSSSQPSP